MCSQEPVGDNRVNSVASDHAEASRSNASSMSVAARSPGNTNRLVVNPGAMANSIDSGMAPAPVEAFVVESDARGSESLIQPTLASSAHQLSIPRGGRRPFATVPEDLTPGPTNRFSSVRSFAHALIPSTIPSGNEVRPPLVRRRCKAVRDRSHAGQQLSPSPRPAAE
jgi:hypothetical protein